MRAKDKSKMKPSRAIVLFSGGQDSTVCLALALESFEHVETVGFTYGQRHSVELTCRQNLLQSLPKLKESWQARLKDDHIIDLSSLGAISETSLTRETEMEMSEAGLPNTFVPGRNLLFFTYAAALGYRRGITTLIGGMCETDFSGYPDCRNETLRAVEKSIQLGTEKPFEIKTPLMHIDKAGTWGLAHDIAGDALVDLMVRETHTCYKGVRERLHLWGYGCGECPACQLRAAGFEKYIAQQNQIISAED